MSSNIKINIIIYDLVNTDSPCANKRNGCVKSIFITTCLFDKTLIKDNPTIQQTVICARQSLFISIAFNVCKVTTERFSVLCIDIP